MLEEEDEGVKKEMKKEGSNILFTFGVKLNLPLMLEKKITTRIALAVQVSIFLFFTCKGHLCSSVVARFRTIGTEPFLAAMTAAG